ncbi:hypothetical protein VMCG_03193 [Cytospora schulzeri]|uniref:Carrier domain-containing protein n=1 Tax=Cytospora schulzeri TaxID=448051 RepID=A0A423WXP6_9PEZI|nr:hypothetical protein VMCG_03193 [Valsa malicola]
MDAKHISKCLGELLPHTVERLARENPSAPYGLWPIAQASYEDGFRTIDYGQLANIVNGLAWWIKRNIGTSQNGEKVLAYVGPNDIRFTAMLLAALFLTSPRNSPVAQQSLFTAVNCQILVTTEPTPPAGLAILESVKPRPLHFTIPSIDELLSQRHSLFSYEKSTEEGRWDPLFIIHTSGSTGMPKPKVFTQETGMRHIACSNQPKAIQPGAVSVEDFLQGKRLMVTMPPFHGAGLACYLFWGIPFGTIPIAPAAVGIVTAQALLEALEQTPAEVAFLVPSVVVELAQDPELLARCAKHLELILYAGGDLPQALGDRVAAVIPLRSWWGASECGLPHQLIPPNLSPQDWRYMSFHPSVGTSFEKVTDEDYELVIRRDDSLRETQTCFSIRGHEDLDHYRTRDLFHAHPTVPDAWCWKARADDIIVFLNGEKTNPIPMEQYVVAHNPEISGALVVGTRRFQAALLIELVASEGRKSLNTIQEAELIERIWPSVEEANRSAPAYARVEKALILILPANLPLIRAGKGTIQRPASIAQYTAAIDALYENADVIDGYHDNNLNATGQSVDLADAQSVNLFIRDSVATLRGLVDSETESSSFFERGMDSLMALQLLRMLRRGLHRPDLALSTIYSNPTVSQLQEAITARCHNPPGAKDELSIEPLFKTYNELIQQIPKPTAPAHRASQNKPLTILLTGSTGTVGTFLLRALLDNPNIQHVICLNRSEDGGRAAQEKRFAAAGLETGDLDKHTNFLHADLSQPLLGLSVEIYEDLRTRVGLIVHSAWPVNFNLGLAAFEPHLAGLVNLFRMAADSTQSHAVQVVFISSVSAIGGLAGKAKGQPEKISTSLDTPSSNGYARSKFISELLCDTAVKSLGTPAVVVRLGQVVGAVRRSGGQWNRHEWLPSLIVSSRDLGCLPSSLGPHFSEVDWVPSDLLADVLVELITSLSSPEVDPGSATSPRTDGAQVFNIRNPCTTSWESLLPTITDALETHLGSKTAPVSIVSPSTWLTQLRDAERKATDQDSTTSSSPAMKLLDFYNNDLWGNGSTDGPQRLEPMEIERSLAQSATLRGMRAVNDAWIRKWVDEWFTPDAP